MAELELPNLSEYAKARLRDPEYFRRKIAYFQALSTSDRRAEVIAKAKQQLAELERQLAELEL